LDHRLEWPLVFIMSAPLVVDLLTDCGCFGNDILALLLDAVDCAVDLCELVCIALFRLEDTLRAALEEGGDRGEVDAVVRDHKLDLVLRQRGDIDVVEQCTRTRERLRVENSDEEANKLMRIHRRALRVRKNGREELPEAAPPIETRFWERHGR
jgi:hypothetical protein